MTELKLLQCRVDGRYDIEDCLGRGSYAEIYMARDRAATDERFRMVVIKALNVLLQGYQDPELERTLIQNFQNEAVALDRVRHPHIISRLGHGTALDLTGTAFHYIVLEYLGGGDLALLCRKEPLKLDRALFYLQQLCAGLAHAHECGVIHRDIKPQNLLLTADHETLKIADRNHFVIGSIDRENVFAMQTPQIFARDLLVKAYDRVGKDSLAITDEVSAVEHAGGKVVIVRAEDYNPKITFPNDLAIAEVILRRHKGG